jgi:hypothetical protein
VLPIAPALALLQAYDPQLVARGSTSFVVWAVIKMLVVFTVLLVSVALLTLARAQDRAWIQDRHGARTGSARRAAPAGRGRAEELHEGGDVSRRARTSRCSSSRPRSRLSRRC